MLRCCQSTVRTLGGLDTTRSFLFLSRLSRFQHAGAAVTVATDPVVGPSSFYPPGPRGAFTSSSRSSANSLEAPRRAARSGAGYSAIDVLRRYLSSEGIASDLRPIYSPATVRSLYYRAESRNQLGKLDSTMLTHLISLFGSLSIEPRTPAIYRVPIASRFSQVSACKTYWAFVRKVGRYKLESGMHLQDSDRFWLMRAELAIVQARQPLEPLSRDAYSSFLRARTHYLIIRRHSRHPEVHAYYLETLLVSRDTRLLDLAARDLAFLLRTHRVCHPRLQRILYRLALQCGGPLSTRSQEAILAALWRRAYEEIGRTSDLDPGDDPSSVALGDQTLDATTISRSLSISFFSFPDHLPTNKSMNSFGYLFSVFSPVHALPLRWSSLLLFSIFNSSEMPHLDGIQRTGNHPMSQATLCWQVIFGLATLRRILQESFPAPAMQLSATEGVLETTRSLYQSWLPIAKSHRVSRDVACGVATSFFSIASILADATLFRDCQDLYHVEVCLGGTRVSAERLLAVQYIAAAVRVQGPLSDVLPTVLKAFSPDVKEQHRVLASAVEVLAPVDPSLACALYNITRGKGLEADPGVTYALAMSFAQRGMLDRAILFLNGSKFSLEKRGLLVSAIARSLRGNPRTRHSSSVFVAIVDELAALYHLHVPPGHFRGHLEQLFIALAQHGRGSQLLRVVLSIFEKLPSFFHPRFFVRYCRVLIQRRQFTTASKLLDAITAVHPKTARFLRILTDRIAMQSNTSRAYKRTTTVRSRLASLRLSSRLRRRSYTGQPLRPSLQELLGFGRLLAAKQIFTRAAATISSRRCTTLGNILLHGVTCQPTPRNGRRVRKALLLLESLVKNHSFRPDRVTANILIKAMISWRSAFDSPRLRELFDQLVRGGYPAADYSTLHPPFGTQPAKLSGLSSFPKLPPLVSFEKHTRPLFKMFIKAFYLCNDVEAARKVVGILKVEEHKNAVAKEVTQRARSKGRVKAGQRNVTQLDATVH